MKSNLFPDYFYKGITLLAFAFTLSACASTDTILEQHAKINYYDGIGRLEAKVLAQKTFLDMKFAGDYDVFSPSIFEGPGTEKYPNFWFITFPLKSSPESPRMHLIVIDKRSGGILRSQEWRSDIHPDFEWLFK